MYLVIQDADRFEEGVALAVSGDRIRVALRGRSETVEFRRFYDQWTTEAGAPVEIAAFVPGPDSIDLFAAMFPRTQSVRN